MKDSVNLRTYQSINIAREERFRGYILLFFPLLILALSVELMAAEIVNNFALGIGDIRMQGVLLFGTACILSTLLAYFRQVFWAAIMTSLILLCLGFFYISSPTIMSNSSFLPYYFFVGSMMPGMLIMSKRHNYFFVALVNFSYLIIPLWNSLVDWNTILNHYSLIFGMSTLVYAVTRVRETDMATLKAITQFANSNPNPIFSLSRAGKVLFCNGASKKFCEQHDMRLGEVCHDLVIQSWLRQYNNNDSWQRITHERGGQFYNIDSSYDSENHVLNFFVSDITQEVIREKEFQKERERMDSAARFAALGQTAGGVAHEINNPLAIIMGRATQIKMGLKKLDIPEEDRLSKIHNGLESIQKTVLRIRDIIDGLKYYAREGQLMDHKEMVLQDVIHRSLSFTRARLQQAGIEINIELPEKAIKVWGSATQLSQVILNLLTNSCYFIENQERSWINISLRLLGDKAEIRITDSGNGIPESDHERIMQPFYTTKSGGEGTGLGLSVSLGIVSSHHGRLYLNRESENTEFVIVLPVSNNNCSTPCSG